MKGHAARGADAHADALHRLLLVFAYMYWNAHVGVSDHIPEIARQVRIQRELARRTGDMAVPGLARYHRDFGALEAALGAFMPSAVWGRDTLRSKDRAEQTEIKLRAEPPARARYMANYIGGGVVVHAKCVCFCGLEHSHCFGCVVYVEFVYTLRGVSDDPPTKNSAAASMHRRHKIDCHRPRGRAPTRVRAQRIMSLLSTSTPPPPPISTRESPRRETAPLSLPPLVMHAKPSPSPSYVCLCPTMALRVKKTKR